MRTTLRAATLFDRHPDANRYIAELIGTFVLVLGGVGCAVLAGHTVGALGVALAFGFSLLAMVYAIGPISGCHINPAVTIGLWLSGKFHKRLVLGYLIAQVVGAFLASLVILIIAKGSAAGYSATVQGLGANGYGIHSPSEFGFGAALLTEIVFTCLFVLVVLFATDARAPVGFAGLAIGIALALVHLVTIPVTNTSVNPARSIGPAIFVGGWALEQLWLFIFAPLVGGAAAAAIHRALNVPALERISATEAEQALDEERAARTH